MIDRLNIGCGSITHPEWLNLDVFPIDKNVIRIDVKKGLPYRNEFASVCYSSHVLEHLDKADALSFLKECFRVLKPGGVVRIVVPDLEVIAKEYLNTMSLLLSGASGQAENDRRYDWLMLEMYDQVVRSSSGGEMANFLKEFENLNDNFVKSRVGFEGSIVNKNQNAVISRCFFNKYIWMRLFKKIRTWLAGVFVFVFAGSQGYKSYQRGVFRDSGEVHMWMYDRYSLKRLMTQAGFKDIKLCNAYESTIQNYSNFSLDLFEGKIRKPDSLYMEAKKT